MGWLDFLTVSLRKALPPAEHSLERLISQLPEQQQQPAIMGTVRSGVSKDSGHLDQAIIYMLEKKDDPGIIAEFALAHGKKRQAVDALIAGEHYGNAALLLIEQGRLEEAEQLFPKLPQTKDWTIEGKVYEKAADATQAKGLSEQAKKYFTKALDDYRVHNRINDEAALAERLGMIGRAIEAYLAIAKTENAYNAAWRYREAAKIAKKEGWAEEAKNYYRQALELHLNSDPYSLFQLATALDIASQLPNAAEMEVRVYEKDGKIHTAAKTAAKAGLIDHALSLYVQLPGWNHDAMNEGAKLAVSTGRIDEAIDFLVSSGREKDYNYALELALRYNKKEKTKELCQGMINFPRFPHEDAYRTLVTLASQEGNQQLVTELSQKAVAEFLPNGNFSLVAYFTRCLGDEQTAAVYDLLALKVK